MYLAIDPGGVRTGWAYFDSDGSPVSKGIVDVKDDENWPSKINQMLRNMRPAVLIVEEFKLYPWKATAQGFSQMRQSQVIGALKMWASQQTHCLVVEQKPQDMKMGFIYQGKTMPKHPKDDEAALAHGVFYLTKLGKIRPANV